MDSLDDCEISAMEHSSFDGNQSSVLESLNEDSDENKLEITRNPFDSNLYDKDNFPSLDASVFTENRTPDSRSPAEFRWSIDQIAKLKPADLDMYPNQEYSVIHERKEDEEREQEKVDEYFKNVLLPSPWLENRVDPLKRVTFSPHPPSTRYIQDPVYGSDDVMMSPSLNTNNSNSNSNNNTNRNSHSEINGVGVNRKSALHHPSTEGVSTGVDACCQTMLTFPMDFNLYDVLGKEFFSYEDETYSSKEIAVTSLRRKLFGQDSANNTPTKRSATSVGGLQIPDNNKGLNTPSYTTSSPSKVEKLKTPLLSKSSDMAVDYSPPLTLDRNTRNREVPSVIITPDSECSPPKQASNVGTPASKRLDISFSSVDVSPIRSCEKRRCGGGGGDLEDESNYSFLPNVSYDLNATEESVFESSRAALKFDSPDISPIKVDQRDEFTQSNTGADSLELRDTSSLQQQSIKESTARNMHAFSGLEELSSISQSESKQTNDEILEDRGPLDITELEGSKGLEGETEDDDSSDGLMNGDDDHSPDLLDITDLDTTKEQNVGNYSINDSSSNSNNNNNNNNNNSDDDSESVETPKLPGCRVQTPASAMSSACASEEFVTTPLKGILKRRDFPVSGSSNTSSDYEQDTKFNTERNSGRARDRILQSLDPENSSSSSSSSSAAGTEMLNVKPLSDAGETELLLSKSEEKAEWNLSWKGLRITEATFSDELVCRRAFSALKRSRKLTGLLEREFFDKENKSPWQHRLKYQLNSTEVASGLSANSSAAASSSATKDHNLKLGSPMMDVTNNTSNAFSEQRSDSGVASMDWANESNLLKPTSATTVTTPQTSRWRRSISPLTKFDQLSLHTGHTPLWNQSNKTLPSSRLLVHASPNGRILAHASPSGRLLAHASSRSSSFLNRSNSQLDRSMSQRFMITKSHSWPHNKSRSHSASPYLSSAPRSRVAPKSQSKHSFLKNEEYNSLFKSTDFTSFKDFLPSPLK